MSWRRQIAKIGALFRRQKPVDDLAEEIRSHLEMEERENREAGMPPDEAHYAALRRFGNVTQAQETSRETWGWPWLETIVQDLRYGLRQLGRNPGFTAVAVITLALGIGANTAIFSLIDAVMLQSLPVRKPSQLVVLRWSAHKWPQVSESSSFGDCEGGSKNNPSGCSLPFPFFEQVRSQKDIFSEAAAFAGPAELVLTGNGAARMVRGEMVSGDYFSTLGVGAAAGRTLGLDDDKVSASPAIVLGYKFWQSAFGGDRSVIGRTVTLNATLATIVGVADPSFTSFTPGGDQDVFLPLSLLPSLNVEWGNHSRSLNNWWLVVVARLKAGISREKAGAEVGVLCRNIVLHGDKPPYKASDDPRITLLPAQSGLSGRRAEIRMPLYILMGIVSFILLIACANVAGLLLSRAAARQKEMAVRLSVGADRQRIVRQLLTESLLLSISGGALGVLFAVRGVHWLTTLISKSLGRFTYLIEPDWNVMAFTVAISAFTGIAFGLAPALRTTRVDLTPALKEGSSILPGAGAGSPSYLGNALVVAQVVLSMIVLVGAGLMVRTLENLHNVDPGFDTKNVLLFGIDPTLEKYTDVRIEGLYRGLREQFSALPGVISASYSFPALLTGSLSQTTVHVEGRQSKEGVPVDELRAGPGFFETMGIPLVTGRTFTAADFKQAAEAAAFEKKARESAQAQNPVQRAAAGSPPGPTMPVVVNRLFAQEYLTGQNPLGKRLGKSWQIVGVMGDIKYNSLRREIQPTVYVPKTGGGAEFELRTASNPETLIPEVRKVVEQADKKLPLASIRTQKESIEKQLAAERVIAQLASFFGVLALVLACGGVYGLLSYEVARRTREIGIRMALGAEKRDVLRMVVGHGVKLALIGVLVGIAGALALTRFLASLLYGVKPTDPLTFAAVSLILIAVALLACYIPARRASKVDPMVALRYE